MADFQRRVPQLLAVLNIQTDLSVTRHHRVEIWWSFPHVAVHHQRQGGDKADLSLSP